MGQYYKPINIDKKQWLYSHSFKTPYTRNDGEVTYLGQGLKLTEHSYLGNPFMEAVEVLLVKGGDWHKDRIVWAGDYAEPEKGSDKNLYCLIDDDEEDGIKKTEPIEPSYIHDLKNRLKINDLSEYRYIVNHTKKSFVDKEKVKEFAGGYRYHPLSLLTAEGNGGGGGDYYENNPDYWLVGSWARDSISIEKEVDKNYEELIVNFKE